MSHCALTFLGATGTVTGSKYLVEAAGKRLLVDCGLFQGYKQLRLRNRAPLPVDPATIDGVVLTHAHLDHSGYLPVLMRNGYTGPVLASQGTRDLCGVLLPDSGHLQERDAEFANRHGFSRHRPAEPLYTERDGRAAAEKIEAIPFGSERQIAPGLTIRLDRAGHILGAAIVTVEAAGRRLVFSGDLGRGDCPLMPAPTSIARADHVVVESTYGGRLHDQSDPQDRLEDVINATAARGGTVVIPAFAVGRTQLVMYHLYRLRQAGRIRDVPVYLDSPMAINASEIFHANPADHRLDRATCDAMCRAVTYVRDVEDSKALDQRAMPAVIISASGMATGGRVLHHIKAFGPDPRHTILFTGYQAGGTRGDAMVRGVREIKIHGRYLPIRAEVSVLDMLSAHADEREILAWLGGFERPPTSTFITHGEPPAADALRLRIEESLGWTCAVPEHLERRELP